MDDPRESDPGGRVLEYQSPGTTRVERPSRVPSPGEERFKIATLASIFVLFGMAFGAHVFFWLGLLIWTCVLFGPATNRWTNPQAEQKPIGRGFRIAIRVLFVATLVAIPLTIRWLPPCPHGTKSQNLGIGIAHSTTGGPCNVARGSDGARLCWQITSEWYVFVPG